MVDIIPVFSVDEQIADDNGDPVSGGSLTFYDAGTLDARAVYSDPALSTSLGNVVSLNAGGRPVSGSSLVTIYTGTTAYKVLVKDADGVTLRTHDNLPGALDTSGYADDDDVSGLGTGIVATQTISDNDTAVAGDEGHVFNLNPSGGSKTLTLPSSTTAGDGWPITVRHDGTSNAVLVATVGGDTIQHAGQDVETLLIQSRGESVTLVADGATSWLVVHHSDGLIKSTIPQIVIESITATPPGSPTPGQTYILDSAPSGAWSAQAQHDVARWTGGEWIFWTPATDSGWTAYDKNTNTEYQFQASAWVARAGTVGSGLTQSSGVLAVVFADAADMEAAAENDETVTPVLQHRHPGHAKAAVNFQGSGTAAILWDYGTTSITDNGTGNYTVTLDAAFSSTSFAATSWCRDNDTTGDLYCSSPAAGTKTTTQFQVYTVDASAGARDSGDVGLAFFGDQ